MGSRWCRSIFDAIEIVSIDRSSSFGVYLSLIRWGIRHETTLAIHVGDGNGDESNSLRTFGRGVDLEV